MGRRKDDPPRWATPALGGPAFAGAARSKVVHDGGIGVTTFVDEVLASSSAEARSDVRAAICGSSRRVHCFRRGRSAAKPSRGSIAPARPKGGAGGAPATRAGASATRAGAEPLRTSAGASQRVAARRGPLCVRGLSRPALPGTIWTRISPSSTTRSAAAVERGQSRAALPGAQHAGGGARLRRRMASPTATAAEV